MTSFVVGTAGHVDHGKTTLIRALTGIDTDRFREEKERGLTIDIGFAHLDLGPEVRVGIVDVPGHRDFIGNMLTGSTGLDAVLLVVSAADGPMPQTREHLQIASLLGIRHGVVALTNVDRVETAFADLAEEAVAEEVRSITGHDDWPIVRVDALRGEGVDRVRAELTRLAGRVAAPVEEPIFRLPVDRSFTVAGTGTVVTGTTWSGRVEIGDRLWVLPAGHEVRVRSLQAHGSDQERVGPRRRCAAGLVGVGVDEVGRGDTLVSRADWAPARRLGVAYELLADGARLLEHGMRVRVWLGTREVMARVQLPDRAPAAPGDRGHAVLACESPLVSRVGDRCILRFYSPVELLGGLRVAELDPPEHWAGRRDDWDAVLGRDPGESVAAAARLAGGRGLTAGDLQLRSPHPVPATPPPEWDVRLIGDHWFAPGLLSDLRGRFTSWLAKRHEEAPRVPAVPLESLRAVAGGEAAAALVDATIEELTAEGSVVLEGPEIRLAVHRVELTETETAAMEELYDQVLDAGLMPPAPSELCDRLGIERSLLNDLLRLLVDSGRLIAVSPDLYLAVEREAELRRAAQSVLATTTTARPTDFREALGVTRRFLIPLLGYLDTIGWTRRTPEGRIAGPATPSR